MIKKLIVLLSLGLFQTSFLFAASENLVEMIDVRAGRLEANTYSKDQLENPTTLVWQPETLIYTDIGTGHEVTKLSNGNFDFATLPDISWSHWSADGKRFSYGSNRDTSANTSGYELSTSSSYAGAVMMMRADGSYLRPANNAPFEVYVHSRYLHWSPTEPDVYYGFGRNYAGEGLQFDDLYKVTVGDTWINKEFILTLNTNSEATLKKAISGDGKLLFASSGGSRFAINLLPTVSMPDIDGWPAPQRLDDYWGNTPNDMLSVAWGIGSTVYFAGEESTYRLVGTTWSDNISTIAKNRINDIGGISTSELYFVAETGIIKTATSGISWTQMTENVTTPLNGVYAAATSSAFVVGDSGVILSFDGDGNNDATPDLIWEAMTSNTTANLNSICGNGSSDMYAVGDGGIIMHFNGSSWSSMTSNTTANLTDVWCYAVGDIYAVGDGGRIQKYNGSTWSQMTSNTTANLNSIYGSSLTDIYAVGDGGVVMKYGGTWATMTSNTTTNLNSVWTNGLLLFAAGENGWVSSFDGTTWAEIQDVGILYTYHDGFVTGVGSDIWYNFIPEGRSSWWRSRISTIATDGEPVHTVDNTAPFFFGDIEPVMTGFASGGTCDDSKYRSPWNCDGDPSTGPETYLSHPGFDKWGEYVVGGNSQQYMGWGVWDLTNGAWITANIPMPDWDWHDDWSAFSDYFTASPTSTLGTNKDMYIAKIDGSDTRPISNAHLRELGSRAYDSLTRSTQSPDGTKVIWHGDFMKDAAEKWDLFYTAAYYPHPPEIISVTGGVVRFDWRTDQTTSRGYTQRGWPNQATDDPPPPRETSKFRLWKSVDGSTGWVPVGTVDADIFTKYNFVDGTWIGTKYWEITDPNPSGYYAVTAIEWSGLESRTPSNVFSAAGTQFTSYPADPKGGSGLTSGYIPTLTRYYNIYAKDGAIPPINQTNRVASVPVASVPVASGFRYIDWLGKTDGTTKYIVTAVDTQGNESVALTSTYEHQAIGATAVGQYTITWESTYDPETPRVCSSETLSLCTSVECAGAGGNYCDGVCQTETCPDPGCVETNGGVEICGDGIDQDCSGIDLVCSPTPGAGMSIGSGGMSIGSGGMTIINN